MEFRGKCISYSCCKKKEIEKKGKFLFKNIGILESNLSESSGNSLDALKEELSIICKNKMQGLLIRSRTQIIDDEKHQTIFVFLKNTIIIVKSFLN